jgi:hypothetical protein
MIGIEDIEKSLHEPGEAFSWRSDWKTWAYKGGGPLCRA